MLLLVHPLPHPPCPNCTCFCSTDAKRIGLSSLWRCRQNHGLRLKVPLNWRLVWLHCQLLGHYVVEVVVDIRRLPGSRFWFICRIKPPVALFSPAPVVVCVGVGHRAADSHVQSGRIAHLRDVVHHHNWLSKQTFLCTFRPAFRCSPSCCRDGGLQDRTCNEFLEPLP